MFIILNITIEVIVKGTAIENLARICERLMRHEQELLQAGLDGKPDHPEENLGRGAQCWCCKAWMTETYRGPDLGLRYF